MSGAQREEEGIRHMNERTREDQIGEHNNNNNKLCVFVCARAQHDVQTLCSLFNVTLWAVHMTCMCSALVMLLMIA